jgi:hypothetical protein
MPTPAPPTHPALGLNAAPSNQRKHVGLREREPFELLTLDGPPQGNHQLRDARTRETVERDAETSGRTHPRGASYFPLQHLSSIAATVEWIQRANQPNYLYPFCDTARYPRGSPSYSADTHTWHRVRSMRGLSAGCPWLGDVLNPLCNSRTCTAEWVPSPVHPFHSAEAVRRVSQRR